MNETMIDRRRMLTGMAAGLALSSGSGRVGAAYDPPPAPRLPGAYVSPPGTHPFVFATPAKLHAFLDRRGGTFDRARAVLEQSARSALKDPSRYTTPFSGCTLDRYLHALTYEYGGAARVAADLATYAYLTSLGRGYGDPSLAAQAQDTAKQILMRWSTGGFRDGGALRSQISQYCDEQGADNQGTRFAVGLQLGRGIPNWIHAQDLLTGLGNLNATEHHNLSVFLDAMGLVIQEAANYRAENSNLDCNRFSNHVSIQIAALIAIARMRDNRHAFEDASFATQRSVLIPWTTQAVTTVYGPNAKVMGCYASGSDPNYAQTPHPEPGEMVDRFRAGRPQTLGYPMFSLTHLLLAAEILRGAGFQPYGSIGSRPNPLLAALRYYGYYFTTLLNVDSSVVPDTLRYPGHEQYAGKLITNDQGKTIEAADGLLIPFLMGSGPFGSDPIVSSVVDKAFSFAPTFQAFSAVGGLHIGNLADLTV